MILGPIQFDAPLYLLLAPILWALAWLIARKSLSGLGRVTRRVAIAARGLLIALLAVALADPHWRREAEDVAVVVVADASRSMPQGDADALKEYLTLATGGDSPTDRIGLVTAAEQAYVQARPVERKAPVRASEELAPGEWFLGPTNGTDLQSGIETAIAIFPEDAAGRILLHSDGNETDGSLLAAASAAKAAGIPIDVLPLAYRIEREVVFERLLAPATGRRGQTINLRLVLEATEPTVGRLTLTQDGDAVDLTPGEDGVSSIEQLDAGRNVLVVPVTLATNGPQAFEAIFEPLDSADDAIRENNKALGVTFVSGAGRVLAFCDNPSEFEPIRLALAQSGTDVEIRPSSNGHESIVELQRYDAVILANVPSYSFSARQMDELASYVHDGGGGLVMLGGPNSFGAGGWIGTPVADTMPVLLDPPDKRQLPRGALALVMHSIEMPKGVYWGKQVANAASDNLSRLDLIGVVEWSFTRGAYWPYPMRERGDGTAVRAAINSLSYGDMPDFAPTMQAAFDSLNEAKAGQKHAIVISDGDPSPPSRKLLQDYRDAGITISTVCVFPHGGGGTFGGGDTRTMELIANATGGTYYFVNTQARLAQLPSIFIKEAQIVRRSMIWEGDAINPQVFNVGSPTVLGLGGLLPGVTGYVVTAEREGLAQTTSKAPNGDPITAQWQHGLGRTVAITTDATARWANDWLAWGGFDAFWDQHMRWVMRPSGSANVSVTTETRGERTNVIISALDAGGARLNFADFAGRVVLPDLSAVPLDLRQTGPGRYEASFTGGGAGSSLLSLRYEARDESGEVVDRGFVQSAVTKPFADEHRSIQDNTPLLVQVAEMTGGRVLGNDPDGAALFSRSGLAMPVSLRPVWLVFALSALGVFLVDVAVRRVRIDLLAMANAVRRLGARKEAKKVEQVGALRAAKAKTQESFEERGAGSLAERKFEAGDDLQKSGAGDASILTAPGSSDGSGGTDSPTTKTEPIPGKRTDGDEEDAGMSRLLKAKRRAQETFEKDRDDESQKES